MRQFIRSRLLFVALPIVGVLSLGFTPAVNAQAAKTLKYGDTIIGEISPATPKVSYTVSGKKGDVVVVDLQHYIPNGTSSDYSPLQTAFLVTTSSGQPIINLPEFADRGAALLAADGDFTIQVSAKKDATGDNAKGKFYLILSQAPALQAGQSVQATSTGVIPLYYVVPNKQRFGLNFEQVIKDNNYTNLNFMTLQTPSSDEAGKLFTESTLSAKNIVSSAFIFDNEYDNPLVLLQMLLTETGKDTPIDFRLTLQTVK